MTEYQLHLALRTVMDMRLCGHLIETRSTQGDWMNYRLSDGTAITERVVYALVEAEIIKPNDDGLFGDSQTYSLTGMRKTLKTFLSDRFGADWHQMSNGRKPKIHKPGRAVRKKDLDTAKALHAISEVAVA